MHTKSINSSQEYKSIFCDVDKKQDSHSPLTYLFFKNKSMVGVWHLNAEHRLDEAKIVFIKDINIHRE